jgi:hypothetical protein
VGSVAQASLTTSLVPVTYNPASGITNTVASPARTFDLMVHQTSEKWDVTTLQGTIGTGAGLFGSFYAPANHSDIRFSPTPPSPNLAYDTAVTTPRWEQTSNVAHIDLLGKSDYPANTGAGTFTMPSTGGLNNKIDIAWGDKLGTTDAGTTAADGDYRVARITVIGNTGVYFSGYSAGNAAINTPQTFTNLYLPVAGDVNLDHIVDTTDFNIWIKNAGKSVTDPGMTQATLSQLGDINIDGIIDTSDFNVWIKYAGNELQPPAGAALGSLVPEPATGLLLGLAGVAGLGRRRRS